MEKTANCRALLFIILTKYYSSKEIKEKKLDRICSMWEKLIAYRILVT
jgi:hypothetical protein